MCLLLSPEGRQVTPNRGPTPPRPRLSRTFSLIQPDGDSGTRMPQGGRARGEGGSCQAGRALLLRGSAAPSLAGTTGTLPRRVVLLVLVPNESLPTQPMSQESFSKASLPALLSDPDSRALLTPRLCRLSPRQDPRPQPSPKGP